MLEKFYIGNLDTSSVEAAKKRRGGGSRRRGNWTQNCSSPEEEGCSQSTGESKAQSRFLYDKFCTPVTGTYSWSPDRQTRLPLCKNWRRNCYAPVHSHIFKLRYWL